MPGPHTHPRSRSRDLPDLGFSQAPPLIPRVPIRELEELLDLASCGEKVIWPNGFSASIARAYIHDYNAAIDTCRLYRSPIDL